MKGVKLPKSSPLLLTATRWLAMRLSSTMMTRRCRVFSDTRCPSSFSTHSVPAQVHAHRGQVVEPIGIGQKLARRDVFADPLGAAVQVADMRRDFRNHLAVGPQHEPQHAVRARVLRAHVNQHFVRANVEFDRFGVGRGWWSSGLSRQNSVILGRLLVVFSQRVARPIFGAKDASQVGMADKINAHQIENLALVPLGRPPNAG